MCPKTKFPVTTYMTGTRSSIAKRVILKEIYIKLVYKPNMLTSLNIKLDVNRSSSFPIRPKAVIADLCIDLDLFKQY